MNYLGKAAEVSDVQTNQIINCDNSAVSHLSRRRKKHAGICRLSLCSDMLVERDEQQQRAVSFYLHIVAKVKY